MKRFGYIFAAMLYVALSAGVVLSWHYCGGRLEGVSLTTKAEMCNGCTGGTECCHSETELWQLSDEQVAAVAAVLPSDFAMQIMVLPAMGLVTPTNYITNHIFFDGAPPDIVAGTDILIRECRFRC